MKKFLSFLALASMTLSSVPAFAASSMMMGSSQMPSKGVMVGGAMMVQNKDIVDNAIKANNVTTVVAAVKAAGLVDTLKGAGPFTVFAPDNNAFKRLPAGTVANLLKPENKSMLTSILTYHVVAGRYMSKDLTDGMVLTTVNGAKLMVKRDRRNIWINGVRVITRDIVSKNGVTFVISGVLMPPKDTSMQSSSSMMMTPGVMVGGAMMVPNLDIVANAMNASNVTTVVAAVKAAGLVDTLKGKGPFTVFAPDNAAFVKLPAGTVDMLLKPENKDQLTSILTYHVVAGRYTSKDLKDGMMLTTVNGQKITINYMNGKWWINGTATIETADVISSNGVTFVIDSVLMPK